MQNEISYNSSQHENESEGRPARQSRPSRAAAPKESARPAEPELALFSLIADPRTIAGESPPSEHAIASDSAQELDRLRQALHAREHELESLRNRAEPEVRHEEPVPSSQGLLDSTEAHRMAKEARESERESRRALHAAQQAQKTEEDATWPAHPNPIAQGGPTPSNEQSWETRPLSVQNLLLETAPAEAERNGFHPTPLTDPKASPRTIAPTRLQRPSQLQIQLRAARAEARELEATLSIARDTALTQKLEIARLRSEIELAPERAAAEMTALEEAFRAVLPEDESIDAEAIRIEAQNELRIELDQENEATRQEIKRLQERVALGERETEAHEAERRILRETVAARDTELQGAREESRQLTQHLQEENDLVQELQASLQQEREHNAETQSLLGQLRNTLHQVPGEVETPAMQSATGPTGVIRRAIVDAEPRIASVEPQFLSEQATPTQKPYSELASMDDAPLKTSTGGSGRLFDAWQDDQVRRHFGPFGIDTTRDLVMAPLIRRNPSLEHPAKVLVLGSQALNWTERLAEDLISTESPPFQILLGEDVNSARRAGLQDRPIDEFITATRTPASPADFEALIAETRPSVIVSRNFLSGMSDVAPWLDVLRQLPRMGPGLVFLEATGVGPVSPVDAMSELGDRIWSLMPARYTREGTREDVRIESWQDAFRKMQPVPSNGLRAALREGFELEISAQFGFLTEPFLRSPVAENFDPEAQRDRRFLHQIADLDDRKIEAGVSPALHFVARVDGRIEE